MDADRKTSGAKEYPTEALNNLTELRDFLREQAPGNFPEHIANWGADALSKYLENTEIGLQAAFGLIMPAHRIANTSENERNAIDLNNLKRSGKSWKQIISADPNQFDSIKRNAQRLLSNHKSAILADELEKRLELRLSNLIETGVVSDDDLRELFFQAFKRHPQGGDLQAFAQYLQERARSIENLPLPSHNDPKT